jgi:hypothetical protein
VNAIKSNAARKNYKGNFAEVGDVMVAKGIQIFDGAADTSIKVGASVVGTKNHGGENWGHSLTHGVFSRKGIVEELDAERGKAKIGFKRVNVVGAIFAPGKLKEVAMSEWVDLADIEVCNDSFSPDTPLVNLLGRNLFAIEDSSVRVNLMEYRHKRLAEIFRYERALQLRREWCLPFSFFPGGLCLCRRRQRKVDQDVGGV